MQAVKDEIETIHLYVVREGEKKPYALLPLLCALVCLFGIVAVTLYSATYPAYEHKRLTIPAHFMVMKFISPPEPILPTGIQSYSATIGHGTLTLTNGSVVTEILPKGIIITGKGIEVVTESSVLVPAGSAAGYGVATVPAEAVAPGKSGNIPPLSINAVYGTALYVRNLTSFIGGKDAYAVKVVTNQDKQTALDHARTNLKQAANIKAILASPCKEASQELAGTLAVDWTCQFVSVPHISIPTARIIAVTLHGKNLLVDVVYVARPVMTVYR